MNTKDILKMYKSALVKIKKLRKQTNALFKKREYIKTNLIYVKTLRDGKYWTQYEMGQSVSCITVCVGNIDDLYITIEASALDGKSFISSDEDYKKLFYLGVEKLKKY